MLPTCVNSADTTLFSEYPFLSSYFLIPYVFFPATTLRNTTLIWYFWPPGRSSTPS